MRWLNQHAPLGCCTRALRRRGPVLLLDHQLRVILEETLARFLHARLLQSLHLGRPGDRRSDHRSQGEEQNRPERQPRHWVLGEHPDPLTVEPEFRHFLPSFGTDYRSVSTKQT
jgi:hypothetical protein